MFASEPSESRMMNWASGDRVNKVLLIHGVTQIGGAERELLRILDDLPSLGYHPVVACPPEGPFVQELDCRKIEHHTVVFPPWHKLLGYAQRAFAVRQLRQVICEVQPVLLHVNDIWWVPQTLRAAVRMGMPVVAHVRQEIEPRKVRHYDLVKANLVLAVSRRIQDALVGGGVSVERAKTVYSGLDLHHCLQSAPANVRTRFGIPADAPLLGTVGSLFPRKGYAVMLKALPSILSSFPTAHYLVIGTGDADHERKLRSQVVTLGLEGRVHFTGFQEAVYGALAALTVYVHPALMEGFGIAVLEAMAMEKPVVATATGGLPEIVQGGETGLLVPPGDAVALAQAVMALLRDPARATAMGKAGRSRVGALFSHDMMLQQLRAAYDFALRDAHPMIEGVSV
jgi:glycosyltransferase involved in cell wall biosynthesis